MTSAPATPSAPDPSGRSDGNGGTEGERRRERAMRPEDLSRFVVERLNAGDVDGLVALYEPDAVLALADGQVATGSREIRRAYERIVADRPVFSPGEQQPTLRNDDLALTAVRLPGGGATVEVARRQPDGTWLWTIDQPSFPAG